MRFGNRVVILTLCMVMLAGLLSAGAALWLARSQSNSYDSALKDALQEKAFAYGLTATVFVDVLGDDAITVLQSAADTGYVGSPEDYETGGAKPTFFNNLLSFSVWLPDTAAAGGYRPVATQDYESTGEPIASDEVILGLLQQTQATQSAAAVIDEDNQLLLTSVVVPFGDEGVAFVVGVISAEEEFAFFAAQRREALRNGILTSAVIIALVSLIGAGLGYYVSRDLTSRRKAEEVLRESEEKYRAIFEGAQDVIYETDISGVIVSISPSVQQYGYSHDQLRGTSVLDVYEDPEEREALVKTMIECGEVSDYELRLKTTDGRAIDVSLSARLVHDAEGKATGIRGVMRDITERKRAEEALRESEELYRITLGSISDAVLITDDTGAFTFVCPNVAAIFDRSLENVRALGNISGILGEGLFDPAELESRGEIANIEHEFKDKAGNGHALLVNVKRVSIREGTRLYTCRDITERKQAEELLQKRTHDLRERVKELDCLYGISKLVDRYRDSPEDVLQSVADLIPSGWQYPEVTCARVILDGQEYRTENFRETPWRQAADIILGDERLGAVEVRYLEKLPGLDEGPFLKEERNLITAIAQRLTVMVERKAAEDALRESEERARAIIETAYDAFISMDTDGVITEWNGQAETIFGWSRSEAVGRELAGTIIPPQHREAHEAGLDRFMASGDGSILNERVEITAVHRDGHEFAVELAVWPAQEGETKSFNAFIHDITDRKRMEDALRDLATRDALTGVLNHGAITDELRSAIAAAGDDAPCAVAMVDVDGLKATNDTYGHQVGDAVLINVAGALSKRGALVGRYGGDEFLAVLPSADRDEAEQYRGEVAAALADARVVDAETGASVSVAASIGLAIYPEDGTTMHEIVELSDSAMYASRRQRPVGAEEFSPSRTLGGERAAAMVGQIVPLLTESGTIEDKLRLVAHRLSVGAGYDAVNVDVFAKAAGLPSARNTFSRVPDEVTEAWQAERRRMEDEPILQHVKSTRRALIVEDPQHEDRLTEAQRAVMRAAELQSAVVMPLFWEDDMIGVLSVASKRKDVFTAEDVEFLTAIATQITSVVRMATLLDELQSTSGHLAQAREDAVLLLAASAEAHDSTTGQHLRSVRDLTETLARELSYDEESARELGMAAVLHDIGKIKVQESILASTGSLAADQMESMRKHSVWGADFLAAHPGYELAATVARSHHERWDGGGYPDGLAGEAIPDAAAIVAVADAFDAITSDRPYRDGRSVDDALREIESGAGTQFSPSVVDAFVRIHQRGELLPAAIEAAGEQSARRQAA